MKKILALVLALVMTLSLATISSGAAYSDADKVQYTEAVNMMSALGVMGGYADGSIRPQADVTRGAAAKMVAMVATGSNTTVIGYYAGTSTFADVPATHTFADAVAYCVGKGIVDGYGDGTYGVGDNVKGWAVAKMALVAMGYDAEAFGLTGTGAALRTIELATAEHLFDGMNADFVATAPASREECAQIIWNAIRQPLMVEEGMLAGTPIYGKDYDSCLMDNWDYIETGVVLANAATGADYTVIDGSGSYTNASDLALIGHEVLFADKSYDAVNDAYTAYALVDVSYEVVLSEAELETMDEKAFKAKFGAESVYGEGVALFANYAFVDYDDVEFDAEDELVAGTYVFDVDGELVSYLAPADFDVSYVSDYAAIEGDEDGVLTLGDVDDPAYTWTLDAEYGADVSFYAEIAEGDAVAVQQTGDLYTVSKLETVTGNLTKLNASAAGSSVVVGGKTYALSDKFGDDIGVDMLDIDDALLTDVVLYLDINGAVVAITAVPDAEVEAKTSVVYVVAYYTIEGTDSVDAYGQPIEGVDCTYAQCVDMNGKEVSLLVYDADETGLQVAVEKYDSENKVTYYEFTNEEDVAEGAVSTWEIEEAEDATALKAANGYYYASDVKYIFVNADASDLSKLAVEVKTSGVTVEDGTEFYATRVGETANFSVKYVVIAGEYEAPVVMSEDIVFVAGEGSEATSMGAYKNAEGTVVPTFAHTVYVNGALKEITYSEAEIAGGFYSYYIDENGVYVLDDEVPNAVTGLEVENVFGTMVMISGSGDVEGKDAKVVDVEFAGMTAEEKADAKEIKDVKGLSAGDEVAVVYSVDTTTGYPNAWVTIYVIARAD